MGLKEERLIASTLNRSDGRSYTSCRDLGPLDGSELGFRVQSFRWFIWGFLNRGGAWMILALLWALWEAYMGSAKDPFKKSAKYFGQNSYFGCTLWRSFVPLRPTVAHVVWKIILENHYGKTTLSVPVLLGFQHAARRDLGALAVWQIEAPLLDKEINKHNDYSQASVLNNPKPSNSTKSIDSICTWRREATSLPCYTPIT